MRSPLERRIGRDGISVRVLIHRGEADDGWILEVVDHAAGSTVWEEASTTDRAALDEVLSTIEREELLVYFHGHEPRARLPS